MDDDDDIDLDNNVFSKFDLLNGMDSDSDNEPINKHINANKSIGKPQNDKILIKVRMKSSFF